MKRSVKVSCCFGLVVTGAMVAAPLFASDPVKPAKDAAKDALKQGKDMAKDAVKQGTDAVKSATGMPAGMDPKMAEAMQRMEAYGALNENHAYLKQFEGEWECRSKWWMTEGATPIENTCTSTAKVSYDGHFLIEKYTGTFSMGPGTPAQPFNGMATMGYDNHRKQFVNTWIDNWISGVYLEYGSASEGGKVFTFEGENYCCFNDKICKSKSMITFVDPNTRTMEMWGPGLDGKVYKAMEMTFTRKK